MLNPLLEIFSAVLILLNLLYLSIIIFDHSKQLFSNGINVVVSKIYVSFGTLFDKIHKRPAVCASTPTTGNPS